MCSSDLPQTPGTDPQTPVPTPETRVTTPKPRVTNPRTRQRNAGPRSKANKLLKTQRSDKITANKNQDLTNRHLPVPPIRPSRSTRKTRKIPTPNEHIYYNRNKNRNKLLGFPHKGVNMTAEQVNDHLTAPATYRWNLEILYKGLDDPQFKADYAKDRRPASR